MVENTGQQRSWGAWGRIYMSGLGQWEASERFKQRNEEHYLGTGPVPLRLLEGVVAIQKNNSTMGTRSFSSRRLSCV